ncbi:MAG: hypothetical protein ABI068_13970, partial [Ktedonobacterales bacterium]
FTLVDQTDTFSAVLASAAAPLHAYGLMGTAVYRTQDGGKSWTQTATTGQHPGVLAISQDSATTAYVALSYPLSVERTTDGGAHWRTVLP